MLSKNAFIQLALQQNVLQWGKYTLKSGRISPYFFNAGLFYQNDAVKKLGEYYADLILEHAPEATHLFGPAYKGIPLATATAIALSERGKSLTLTFNRKEIKDHGEGGDLIGAPLNQGTTVMIDDVITAGTAFRESKTFIQKHGGQLTHVFIALDRCERGLGELSAIEEIEQQGITVHPVITLHDLIAHLQAEKQMDLAQALCAYHQKYGV